MYRPPSQTNFLEILNMTFEKVDVGEKEIYILGDFNINIYHNNRYIVRDENTISSKFLSHVSPILYDAWLKSTNSISDSCNL